MIIARRIATDTGINYTESDIRSLHNQITSLPISAQLVLAKIVESH